MRTLWTSSAVERVLAGRAQGELSGSGRIGNGESKGPDEPTIDEHDVSDTAGLPRVGRVDAWRQLGFTSAREMREHHGSDFWKCNKRRTRGGKAALTESEFTQMIEGGDDLSSISGSETDDSDDDSDDDETDEGQKQLSDKSTNNLSIKVGRTTFSAKHGAGEGAQVVCVGGDGTKFALWRCLAGPDSLFRGNQVLDTAKALNSFADLRNRPTKPWVIILARGGHFACAAFVPSGFVEVKEKVSGKDKSKHSESFAENDLLNLVPTAASIEHKTFHRYVVRAKAGGRQSGKDGGGKTIKSAGSSIRRANELALEKEIQETLTNKTWRDILENANLIFVSASKTDTKTLFANDSPALQKSDQRLRRVPFATKRPTFNETRRVVGKLALANYDVFESFADGDEKTGLKQPGEPAKNDVVAPPDASLSASQRLRLQEARARAEQASARVGGLSFAHGVLNEEVLDDDGAGTDASGIPGMKTSSLSKKEKEKAKKLRAKDRAATESAKKSNEETPPPGIEPGTKPTLPEPQTNDLKGNTKGSKAAALLAKAKQSQSAKRNEAALAAERRNACLDAAQKRTAAVVGATHRGAFAGGGGGSIAGGEL